MCFVELKKPGTYVMRVSHAGYTAQILSVTVPPNRTIETSTLLDSGNAEPKDAQGLWQDFESRVRMRGMHSALVPGAALREYAEPGMPLSAIPVDQIEAIELYGPNEGGDATGSLARSWPERAPCGENIGEAPVYGAGNVRNVAEYAVIWLRR